jgi:D-beta-D-heptose 7-phosphate kinase/D-beta-D-heptose 1-phosphate adenosyltransferase
MLKHAKSLGDYLIVGIDSDQKVKKDKGNDRPYNSVEDRKFALESIKYVDTVIVFDSTEDLSQIIKSISPDVMVIGSDWKDKTVIGEEYTQKLCFFDRIERYSTTKILEGIK